MSTIHIRNGRPHATCATCSSESRLYLMSDGRALCIDCEAEERIAQENATQRTLATPVSLDTVPLKEARRRLQQSLDAGDRVRPSNHPDYYLVSSKSKPGFWHATSLQHCDCHAHAYHGLCRHRIRVSWELHQARKQRVAA